MGNPGNLWNIHSAESERLRASMISGVLDNRGSLDIILKVPRPP